MDEEAGPPGAPPGEDPPPVRALTPGLPLQRAGPPRRPNPGSGKDLGPPPAGAPDTDMDTLTDEQLISLIHQGDPSAFNRLTERWESTLYRFIRRVMGNPDDARDVCQEALLKAWVNLPRLRDGSRFKSWLHYIALNICRDRFRSRKVRGVNHSYEEVGAEALPADPTRPWHYTTERATERSSLRDLMEDVLTTLPVEQRTAIVLREFQGFTSDEIAEITGVPSATVRSRIFYGFKALRRTLRERGITEDNFAEGA